MNTTDGVGEEEGGTGEKTQQEERPAEHDGESRAAIRCHFGPRTAPRTFLTTPLTASMWRRFFNVSGGGILFCLSALSILYGVSQIIGPVLAKSGALAKTLPCIGALNLYELALLAALVLLVAWRNVTGDAVSLVLLIALLLVASGVTLATVANDKPGVALLVGVGSLAIAAVKLWVLRRRIRLPLARLVLVGLAILLAWNFLMSSGMALMVKHDWDAPNVMRSAWLIGWLVLLAGGVVMLLHAAVLSAGEARSREVHAPFLRTPGMAWVFALVVLAAANAHQYALTYIFDVPVSFGDFLPIIVLAGLLALELMRIFRRRADASDLVVASLPLVVIVAAVREGAFLQRFGAGLGLLWHPPVVLGIAGGALVWTALRTKRRRLLYVAAAYVFGIVLTAGVKPGASQALHGQAFGYALALSLFVLGIVLRSAHLAAAGVVVLSVTVWRSEFFGEFGGSHGVPLAALVGLAAGLGMMAVFGIFPGGLPRGIAMLFAMVLAASAVRSFGGRSDLDYPVVSGLVVALVGGAVAWRMGSIPLGLVLCVPLVRGFYLRTTDLKGWRYVALSFVLLAAGTLIGRSRGGTPDTAGADGPPVNGHVGLPG